MGIIDIRNLELKLENGNTVLDNINLTIEEGEFIVIIGPSGCSKSTLLKAIAGIIPLDKGSIYLNGEDIYQIPSQNRGISMVFQNFALYPHLDTFENLAFPLRLKRENISTIRRKVSRVLTLLSMANKSKVLPRCLSGGEKQRVAIGRSFIKKTEIFLYDEPLANIDAKLRNQLRFEIASLNRSLKEKNEKTIFIYATHDQSEAMSLGDRVCVMNYGKIMQIGKPIDLYNKPLNKFVASFIGYPQMNIKKGVILFDGKKVYIKLANIKFLTSENIEGKETSSKEKKIWFGIRAEHIELSRGGEEHCFDGIVKLIEPLGYESLVYFDLNESLFVSRVSSNELLGINYGTTLKFVFNIKKAHYFDFFTEERLNY